MLRLSEKDFLLTRHAFDGAAAEDLDERLVYDIVAAAPRGDLDVQQETRYPKGRRVVIVRWVERKHAYYVLNVSARRR